MATSIQGGSDEAYEFVCKPCERDNQYAEGVGYCIDCTEFMCYTCLIFHKKLLLSRDHNTLDKESIKQHGIPRKPPPLPPKPTKPTPPKAPPRPTKPATKQVSFTRKCQNHNDELTKLFCNDHDDLVCTVCMVKDHKQCKDVTYIPDISGNIMQSTEFKHILTEIKRMHALLGFEYNRMTYNERRIDEFYKTALGGVINLKEEMIQAINQMFETAKQDLNVLRDEQMAGLVNWLASYKAVQPEVENTLLKLEGDMSNGNLNELFVDMKLAKAEMDTLRQNTQHLSDENYVTQYKFVGNTDTLDKLNTVDGFGKILKKKNPASVRAEFLHEMVVKSDNDKTDCNINAALVLPDGDLALADNNNKSVKIIDVSQSKVKTEILLESEPFDIAVVGDDQLVVTLPIANKIQFLKLSDTGLTMVRSVLTDAIGEGIDYKDKELISVHRGYVDNPGELHVLNMNGKLVKNIRKDYLERPLFVKPRCQELSVDRSAVYVTEERDNRVILVSLNGEQIAEYQLAGKRTPIGVASDKDGAVYITHGGTHAIYRLSPTCTRPEKILGQHDDLLMSPWALALDGHRDLLYVGSAHKQFSNTISVYQLKYRIVYR